MWRLFPRTWDVRQRGKWTHRGPFLAFRWSAPYGYAVGRRRSPFPAPLRARRATDAAGIARKKETEPSVPSGYHNPREVSRLISRCRAGDPEAFDGLVEALYDDLRRIAHRRLAAERPDHTLRTTALVNEAYMQLAEGGSQEWRSRRHFCAVASKAMRHILVDHARRRGTEKRGGSATMVPLDDVPIARNAPPAVELLTLHEALARLGRRDARLERLVECRFFGGLTVAETAEALGISPRTAERDWSRARAYLAREMGPPLSVGDRAP